MHRLLVVFTLGVFMAACGSAPDTIIASSDPSAEVIESGPTPEGAEPDPLVEAEDEQAPDPDSGEGEPAGGAVPVALLLTAEDVPGWQHSGPMEFPAEPVFVADDCELMNQAWVANTYPGTRTRAGTEGATLRNTVVELEDTATASAVLDAADRVWEECVQFSVNGSTWWAEPIGVPSAGWRSSGLVLGDPNGLIWAIAYWQLEDTIVLLEVEGNRTYEYIQPLLTATAGRLTGIPAPLAPPVVDESDDTPTDPDPRPTAQPNEPVPPVEDPLPIPTFEVDDAWRQHPLAGHVPDASEIGDGWIINSAAVTVYAPRQDNEAFAECGFTEPPTLEGIEIGYSIGGAFDSPVQFVVNTGTAEQVQGFLDVFRRLDGCDPDSLGFPGVGVEITTETITARLPGSDDAVITRIGAQSADTALDLTLVVAAYGELLFAMTTGGFDGEQNDTRLTVDEMIGIIERAARR